jgi:hypothetical protein
MRRTSVNLLFVIIVLFGCQTNDTSTAAISAYKPALSSSQEESWNLMLGKWYGNQPVVEGTYREQIVSRFPNGTYQITFRDHDEPGDYKDEIEVGFWGISGPVYFTIFTGRIRDNEFIPSNPPNPYSYDAYEIIRLTDAEFEYETFAAGNGFSVEKVSDDFEFPN